MRSSVSVILSSPTPDTNMSHPDYEQNAHDHATLLILVKQIGTVSFPLNIGLLVLYRFSMYILQFENSFTVLHVFFKSFISFYASYQVFYHILKCSCSIIAQFL